MKRHLYGPTCVLFATTFASACAQLNSVPFPTYVRNLDYQTVEFLRDSPSISLGLGVSGSDDYADHGVIAGLSITGGGARATGFTLGVLSELQRIEGPAIDGSGQVNALDLIDFASSNSGGSWGLAAYLADRTVCERDSTNSCFAEGPGATQGPYSLEGRRPVISQKLANATLAGPAQERFLRMNGDLFQNVSFGMVRQAGLMDAYINSAIAPTQSPFVFDRKVLAHYQVAGFDFDGHYVEVDFDDPIGSLPLGVAAFTSGAVPGWYHVLANTSLCSRPSNLFGADLCDGHPSRTYLQLVDGGIYDNYGYRTAFDVFDVASQRPEIRRVLIQIDNTTNLPARTVHNLGGPDLLGMLTAVSFFQQDEVFRRTFKRSAEVRGIKSLVLDLFSVASSQPADPAKHRDLGNLYCQAYGLKDDVFFDCLRDPELAQVDTRNFGLAAYNEGMLSKTSFLFDYNPGPKSDQDWGLGTLMWQLGRLSVRMNFDKICKSLFNVRSPAECKLRD